MRRVLAVRAATAAASLILLTAAAWPPSDQNHPAAAAAPAVPLTTFKFGAADGRMTVPVEVDGKGPYNFVIDTGAERSVVSRELATTLNLAAGRPARVFGFAGVSAAGTVLVPSLTVSKLGAAQMEAPELEMANLGAPGMLGIDALQGQRVSIDFARRRMTLMPARHHATGQVTVAARYRLGQLIVTDASFGGHPISVIVDTGSAITVGNRAMLALAKKRPRPLGRVSVVSVTGQSFNADYVAVDGLKIGGVGFDNVALSFANVPPFDRFGLRDTPALILGMSALKLFRHVDIDFSNREIVFTLPRPPIDFSEICTATSPCDSYSRD